MICEEILVSDRDGQSREAEMPYPNWRHYKTRCCSIVIPSPYIWNCPWGFLIFWVPIHPIFMSGLLCDVYCLLKIPWNITFQFLFCFLCPLWKLSHGHRWVAASARPFTMRVCVPAAGEPRACFPNLGNLGNFWELQSPSRSTSHLMHTNPKDPKESKRSKRSQKHFRVSGCLRGILGVHKLILTWTINREPPPPTGSSPKRQADCAVLTSQPGSNYKTKSKVISNHYIQIPQIAGGFKHVLCFLRHDPLAVLHVSRKYFCFFAISEVTAGRAESQRRFSDTTWEIVPR